jgi:hypothetical protein
MAQTRKVKIKHRGAIIEPGSRACHPRLGRSDTCLPDKVMRSLGDSLGAPSELRGISLRRWTTRKTRCKTERCLLEKVPVDLRKKDALLKYYFRPTIPESWLSDPDEWLNSTNIEDVMKQYEETYPEFKFYGTSPIDFGAPDPYNKNAAAQNKCLKDDICKMDLKKLSEQGKKKLGFVYNLDPSNKGGSHWIASFTDIPAQKTYYFDSYGMKPPPEIARFMRSLTLQDPKMKLCFNARRFQYGNTECGMYSLYFLIRMLQGDSFKKFCRRAPSDDEMLKLRKYIFSLKNE